MTVQANAFGSFSAIGNREDLTNVIYNISPTETPGMSAIGKSKAKATKHEWQIDSLASASTTNAQIEGDVVAGSTSAATTRLSNICQISSKDVVVTGTQEVVDKAGRNSEMAYQMAKRAKELKRDMESTIWSNQAGVVGATATARKLRGLEAWLRTNTNRETTATSGGTKGKSATSVNGTTNAATDATITRAFTEALFKKVLAQVFASGGDPSIVMVGPHNKQTISNGFTGRSAARVIVNDQERIQAGADMYASDFGNIKVIPNRFSRERSAIVFDPEFAAVAYLRPVFTYDLAKTGDSIRKDMRVEYTLEMRNEAAFGIIADIKTSS
jgi:hypothetical protein